MQVAVNSREFGAAMSAVARIAAAQSTLPILRNVLLQGRPGYLRVAATDLNSSLDLSLPANVSEEGAVSVPAKLLAGLIGSLPDAEINLCKRNNALHLTCGLGEHSLAGLPEVDYPELPVAPETHSCEFEPALLAEVLKQVGSVPDSKDDRVFASTVRILATPGKLVFMGTDTQVMARRQLAMPDLKTSFEVLIPVESIKEMLALLATAESNVHLTADARQVALQSGESVFISRIVDGNYPDLDRVIGRGGLDHTLEFDRRALTSILQRLKLYANPKEALQRIEFRVEGESMRVSATGDAGQASEEMLVARASGSNDLSFVLCQALLSTALQTLQSIRISLKLEAGKVNPMHLQPVDATDYLVLIQPMGEPGVK